MGGTDGIKGFDYQVTYCVLRILELIIQDESDSTEFLFESLNEDEEDFNILREAGQEFIQVKKRIEGNHWTPTDIKDIFQSSWIRTMDQPNLSLLPMGRAILM